MQRVSAGLPTGGEFARTAYATSDITLDDDPVGDGPAQDHPVEDAAAPTHIGDMTSPEITVTVVELSYAEGTSDKFYRVYSINESELTCQYGRTGTYGTFTPRKAAANAAAAAKAADKATAGKSAKGYQIIRSGQLSFDHTPTDSDLDSAVGRMAAGVSTEVSTPQLREQSAITTAANSGAVDAAAVPRVTAALDDKLGRRSSGGTATVVPMLAQVATKPEVEHMLASPSWVTQPKCIAPTTQILTSDGWSAARYIQVGQSVLTSDGSFHEVEAVHRSPRAGRKMVTIKPWGTQPYDVTTDHKILTTCGWKAASALTLDDRLVTPRPKLSKSLDCNAVHLDAGSGYAKTVECDDEFAWFCGFWMGDGSAQAHHNGKTSGRVSLAVNGDYDHIVSRLLDFIKIRLGCEPHVYSHPKANLKQVYFTDMPFARWLTENFRHQLDKDHADHSPAGKTLPLWMDGWDRARFTQFLNGYFEADGCRVTDSRRPQSSDQRKAVTVSPHIAGRLYRLLLAHGIPAAVVLRRTIWTYDGVKKSGTAWYFDLLRSDRGMQVVGDNWHVRIRSIEPVTRPPVTVLDLTVKGVHGFMAGTIVHNCDGDRVLVVVQDGQVSVFNRSGQPKVRNVGEAHLAPFRALTAGRWVFDGEVVGRVFHVFDMPAGGDYVTEGTGFTRRQEALRVTLEALAVDSSAITKVATATGEDAKREMLQAAKSGRKEGVIFRQADAGYQPGRSEVLRKHKFVKEIDAYVIEVGKGGKENAVLAVRNEAGEEVVVGQVSTIGKGSIRVGDVVETQYLYITSLAKPVLFQPTIMRVRTDKLAAECSTGQLVDSVTDKSVEQ